MKKDKIFVIISILIILGVGYILIEKNRNDAFYKNLACQKINSFYTYDSKTNKCQGTKTNVVKRGCQFEIVSLQEYKGFYSGNDSGYVVYEGLIKNNASNEEYLNAMIGKIYTTDNIYLGEGYTGISQMLKSGEKIPFKIHILISRHETEIYKYFNEETNLKHDIYPWFLSCK